MAELFGAVLLKFFAFFLSRPKDDGDDGDENEKRERDHALSSFSLTALVDAVLVARDLPELGSDLVAALASLDVDDLAHGC